MATILRRNQLFSSLSSRLQLLLFKQQRWTHTTKGEGGAAQEASSPVPLRESYLDTSTWRTVDSRTYGIRNSSIPPSTWTVLKILRKQGFEAYLVGGCVRDLLLGRTPKDFDIVTTATLREIKSQFPRCLVVGRRFPICHVYIFGCRIEVSSFVTTSTDKQMRPSFCSTYMLNNCDKKDLIRWKDCMRRDFTINGLFYDPVVHAIYDYTGGIMDVMAHEVRTVTPAHLSFTEDCARILRGLRIVARLGMQFSKDTATAVQDLSWSILTLDKPRLLMEINNMLAYGAAVPSICLLQKYKLLDVLLPFQAAYLADQAKQPTGESSAMLMKLFSHVDKLLAADRPSDSNLWLGLLAFHMALVNHPQNALVVLTFASTLYLGTWSRGIKFVRENVRRHIQFVPEILQLSGNKSDEFPLGERESDESLMEKASHLASFVISSVKALTNTEALQELLAKCQMNLSCPDSRHAIFVSERARRNVAELFAVLEKDKESHAKERETLAINFELLKRGEMRETRFVIGKVIYDTMYSELSRQESQDANICRSDGSLLHKQNHNANGYRFNCELTHQQNQKANKHRSNGDLLCKQNHNTNTKGSDCELTHQQNQDASMQTSKHDPICEQNSKAKVVEKKRSLAALFE